MTVATSFSIGLGLSMDAFAASFVQGTGCRGRQGPRAVLVALCFSLFAATFLLLGWAASAMVGGVFQALDHWIAFGLLVFLGVKMIRDSAQPQPPLRAGGTRRTLLLASTTSLDAAAVGMTMIVIELPVLQTAIAVALTSFVCTLSGFALGRFSGSRMPRHAECLGGVIMIFIGCKILLSHTLFLQ